VSEDRGDRIVIADCRRLAAIAAGHPASADEPHTGATAGAASRVS
jgi:hypothetical protein